MDNQKTGLKNCFILIMGFSGVGKRTVGEVLAKKMNARFSDHHCVVDPIMKLLGDDYNVQWHFTPEMWAKIRVKITRI